MQKMHNLYMHIYFNFIHKNIHFIYLYTFTFYLQKRNNNRYWNIFCNKLKNIYLIDILYILKYIIFFSFYILVIFMTIGIVVIHYRPLPKSKLCLFVCSVDKRSHEAVYKFCYFNIFKRITTWTASTLFITFFRICLWFF